jgi:hypothetical protein
VYVKVVKCVLRYIDLFLLLFDRLVYKFAVVHIKGFVAAATTSAGGVKRTLRPSVAATTTREPS